MFLFVIHTCEDDPSFALLLYATMFLSRQRVRCLKHKAIDVVALLKVCLLLWGLLLIEVGLDECHLDIGEPGVQLFGVHLRKKKKKQEIKCGRRRMFKQWT